MPKVLPVTISPYGRIVRTNEAAHAIGMSPTYLAKLRVGGSFIEGVHYIPYGQRCFRYLEDAIIHWALHRSDPEEHRRWILSRAKK